MQLVRSSTPNDQGLEITLQLQGDTTLKNTLVRNTLLAALAFAGITLSGGLNKVLAQDWDNRVIDEAQRAVRQRIVSQEGGRDVTVSFNNDAQTDVRSRNAVRVRGTGTFSRDGNSRNDDSRYGRRGREFSYEATVNPYRRDSVSGVKYELRSERFGSDGPSDGRGDRDGRYDDRRGNNDDFRRGRRPDGRTVYTGPIMNRHSKKALDVTDRSNRDGANIQQWSYADQPNQNWEVIDLGNGESAIISVQSGKAITVQGGRDRNGANIIQESWRGTEQQRWRLERVGGDYYRIVSVDNGKCLDVTQAGKEDGANIQLWDYANQNNQQWKLHR